MKSVSVIQNHIGLADSEILSYIQTNILLLLFKDTNLRYPKFFCLVKRKHDELLEDDSDATDDEDGVSLDPTRSKKVTRFSVH